MPGWWARLQVGSEERGVNGLVGTRYAYPTKSQNQQLQGRRALRGRGEMPVSGPVPAVILVMVMARARIVRSFVCVVGTFVKMVAFRSLEQMQVRAVITVVTVVESSTLSRRGARVKEYQRAARRPGKNRSPMPEQSAPGRHNCPGEAVPHSMRGTVKRPRGVLAQPFAATTDTQEASQRFYGPPIQGTSSAWCVRGMEPSVNQPRSQAKSKQLSAMFWGSPSPSDSSKMMNVGVVPAPATLA
jgi:hypothetical protein